jgi:hypothetical protein
VHFRCTAQRLGRRLAVGRGDHEHAGPGVLQKLGQSVRVHHRRDRHGHGTDPHCGEIHDDERGRVRHEHQHALFRLDADGSQARTRAQHAVVHLDIGQVAGRSGQRQAFAGAALELAVEQVGAGVEILPGCGHGITLQKQWRASTVCRATQGLAV